MDKHRSTLEGHPDVGPVLPVFVGRLPGYVRELRRMTEAEDWQGVRKLAHQLKGSGKSYGFAGMSELAGRAETAQSDKRVAVEMLIAFMEQVEGYAG